MASDDEEEEADAVKRQETLRHSFDLKAFGVDSNDRSPPTTITVSSGITQSHAVRIPPNSDLVAALLEAAQQAMANTAVNNNNTAHNAQSAFVMTAVGSLSEVTLRMAATDNKDNDDDGDNQNNISEPEHASNKKRKTNHEASLADATSLGIQTFQEHFEIVSLVGTFSSDGGKHLHMCVSDSQGTVIGGHVMAGIVFTTLELVLGTIQGVGFTREMDEQTGYKELSVQKVGTA